MIIIGDYTVDTIHVGSYGTPTIHVGDYQTFPVAQTRTALTEVHLIYSTGSRLNAAGSNYAQIVGTLITYIGQHEQSRTTVVLTPQIISSPSWLSIYGDAIYAANRGASAGAARSALTFTVYAGERHGDYPVEQAANQIENITSREITDFEINGQTGSVSVGSGATTLYIYAAGRYGVTYSSMATCTTPISAWTCDVSPSGWATVNMVDGYPDSITINQNYGSASRTTTVTLRDAGDPYNTYSSITLTQAQGASPWVLNVPSSISVAATATSFYVDVVSSYMGSSAPIDVEITYAADDWLQVGSVSDYGGGSMRIFFTCSRNTGQYNRTAYLYVGQSYGGQDGEAAYPMVTQSAP